MALPALKIDAPYSRAVAWVTADARARARVSRQTRSNYRRIAKIVGAWGRALDELGASYAQVRFVAGCAGPGLLAEQERRYLLVVDHLRRGAAPKEWEAAAAKLPKVKRGAIVPREGKRA